MLLLASWGLLLFYSTASGGTVGAFPNLCANGSKTEITPLPQDIKIGVVYKVSAVLTNWITNLTMTIEEVRRNDSYTIEATTSSTVSKWSTLSGQLLHATDTGCSVVNSSVVFEWPADISPTLDLPTTSIYDLVNYVVQRDDIRGFKGFVRVVAGIEGVGWVGCMNTTNSSVVAVEVVYAGEESFHPPSRFHNPIILSLAISHYSNASDANSNMTSRISLDFTAFQVPNDMEPHIEVTHGTICNNLEHSEIPSKFPNEFEAIYAKHNSSSVVTSQLMYDNLHNIVMESVMNGTSLLLNESLKKDDYLVVHDISRDMAFTFSTSPPSCTIRSLADESSGASSKTLDEAIELFIPQFSRMNFSLYSNTSQLNTSILEYRSEWEGKVIEATFSSTRLSKVSIYSNGTLESISELVYKERDSRYSDPIDLASLLRGCFEHPSQQPVSFLLKDVTMSEFSKWNEGVVSNALADALSSVTNFTLSPYRLNFFFLKTEEGTNGNEKVRVIMNVRDRGKPTEMISADFITLLNSTLPTGIDVRISETTTWRAKDYVMPFPPPQSTSAFSGYTGGSMLVMGLFMVMLGVAVGAGGVYFAFRRQRISTLAYQVFE